MKLLSGTYYSVNDLFDMLTGAGPPYAECYRGYFKVFRRFFRAHLLYYYAVECGKLGGRQMPLY